MNLGIDTRRGDSQVRGAVMLPHGTGRSVRVGVFAAGEAAVAAKAAGALPAGPASTASSDFPASGRSLQCKQRGSSPVDFGIRICQACLRT